MSRYTVLFNWNNHNIILREKRPSTATVGRRQYNYYIIFYELVCTTTKSFLWTADETRKKGLRPSFGFHFLDAYNIMLNLFSAGVDPRHLFTWHTNGVRTEQNNNIPSSPPNTHFCWLHDWQTAFAKGWKKTHVLFMFSLSYMWLSLSRSVRYHLISTKNYTQTNNNEMYVPTYNIIYTYVLSIVEYGHTMNGDEKKINNMSFFQNKK